MNNKTFSSSGGVGFLGLLTILFIGLKLTGYITWSWWWVLSPLWIQLAIVLGLVLVAVILYGIAGVLNWFVNR